MAIRASAERPGAFPPRPSADLRITGEGGFGLVTVGVFLGFIFPAPCSGIGGRKHRNSDTCSWRTCGRERLKRNLVWLATDLRRPKPTSVGEGRSGCI